MVDLSTLFAGSVFAYMLVLCRVGAAMMTMPGFGDRVVPMQTRLIISLILSLILTPLVAGQLTPPSSVVMLAILVIAEILVGVLLGTFARILMTSLEMGGRLIAHQIGLANAQMLNPQFEFQSALPGVLLSMAGLVLMFVTDLHHILLAGIVHSYDAFAIGTLPDTGDMALLISRTVADGFLIAFQLAAPFIIVSLVLFIGLGLLARLMPQMQIFFISLPVQICLGLFVFILTASSLLLFWLQRFEQGLAAFPGA